MNRNEAKTEVRIYTGYNKDNNVAQDLPVIATMNAFCFL